MSNEAACIAPLFAQLLPTLESITPGWEVICVNDGSSDTTLDALKSANAEDSAFASSICHANSARRQQC